jgi:hypothetical protein
MIVYNKVENTSKGRYSSLEKAIVQSHEMVLEALNE